MNNSAYFIVMVALIGGALRVSTPFMFVALGECLTEKSGRVNLGLEGTLVLGAMSGYAISYQSGSPWLGVLAAGCAGSVLGAMHGYICKLPRVNDIGAAARFVFAWCLDRQSGDRDSPASQSVVDRRCSRGRGHGLGPCQHQMG